MDHNAALTDVGVPPKQVKHLQGSHLGKLGLSQEENFQQKFNIYVYIYIFLASKLETSNARSRTSKRTQEQAHLTISNPENGIWSS